MLALPDVVDDQQAVLATHREDGTVLLSPVYQEWRDGGFNVAVSSNDVKARHLRRDPRASLVEIAELDAAEIEARDGPIIIRLEPRPDELRAWDYADEF